MNSLWSSGSLLITGRPRGVWARGVRIAGRVPSAVCLLALLLLATALLGNAAGYRELIDRSASMSPAINPGDLLLVHAAPALSVEPGAIVTFNDAALEGRLVTHRVISVRRLSGHLEFLTRGDANAAPERWSVPRQGTIGVIRARIPLIGRATIWMTGALARTLVLSLLALVLGVVALRRIWRPMGRGPTPTALALLTLAAVWGSTLNSTLSAFNATLTTPSNAFSTAADWTAPTVSYADAGRTGAYEAGFIRKSASYYVYANVLDSGSPASGIASITANVTSTTPGKTAVALTPGTYSAGGLAYNYRSAALVAESNLGTGSHTFTITSTDAAANVGVQSFATIVDNTAPTAVDVQSSNVNGGTVGHFDLGDRLTLSYSQIMDPYSILSGWTGAATNVQVALIDGGSTSDSIYIYTTAASPVQIPVGVVELGSTRYLNLGAGQYVIFGATGTGTPSTMKREGSNIVITLGSPNGPSLTSTTSANMTWIPSAAATDIAGNAVSSSATKQSGTAHVNF